MVNVFNCEFLKVFDKHALIITKQFKSNRNKKTLSQNTLKLKHERDDAYKAFKISKSQIDKAKFDDLNGKVKKAILKDTKEDLNLKIGKHGVLKTINKYLKLSKKRKIEPFNIPVNDINNYFAEISTKNYNIASFPSKPDMIETPNNRFNICEMELELEEIPDMWNSLKNGILQNAM
jgi:hypothetical protein